MDNLDYDIMKYIIWILVLVGSLILLVILVDSVYAYPGIGYEPGVNITKAKEAVYSIDEIYYQGVQKVIFKKDVLVINGTISTGHALILWNRYHDCHTIEVYIYGVTSRSTLVHELGHIYNLCVLKNDYIDETYAKQFRIDKFFINTSITN